MLSRCKLWSLVNWLTVVLASYASVVAIATDRDYASMVKLFTPAYYFLWIGSWLKFILITFTFLIKTHTHTHTRKLSVGFVFKKQWRTCPKIVECTRWYFGLPNHIIIAPKNNTIITNSSSMYQTLTIPLCTSRFAPAYFSHTHFSSLNKISYVIHFFFIPTVGTTSFRCHFLIFMASA